ncbi:MAG TPA: sulfite exporter TauE/SafE family protein [Rhizomicrobium sp.]|nr:sulfite exporter TauE/SafE family protein [Rhizomicrobium sp.]
MMFKSRAFSVWFVAALLVWVALFSTFDSITFLKGNWYYPAIMVLGAFVAGLTPMGGGSVAFPALSIFLHVDRVLARDFSMMIQSIGMTSASIFILTHRDTVLGNYRPLLIFVPTCFAGFVFGMLTLQAMPVYLIQALFLSLTAAFVIAYYLHKQRGSADGLAVPSTRDAVWLGLALFIGGMVTSLFGTGADMLLYTLLITHFSMKEKAATYISIVLQAAMSVLGFSWRAFVDHGLTHYQIDTWLCAYPVVLFMAPFGAYVLRKLHLEWMLIAVVLLAIFQLLYFNFIQPSDAKTVASAVFCTVFAALFYFLLRHMRARRAGLLGAVVRADPPP